MRGIVIIASIFFNPLMVNSQLKEVNKRRLDSVFTLTDIEISHTPRGTCYALPKENKIVMSSELLNDLSRSYNIQAEEFLEESILAHEYGHLKQHQNQMNMNSDSIFMIRELHCDLMAGFYLSNYFRYEFLNDDISDTAIITRICSFFSSRTRNPNLYLIVSMLMNSSYEYYYRPELYGGNNEESVKLLRLTAFWQGIRMSENQDIDKVYKDGLSYIQKIVAKKEENRTFETFKIIGMPSINDVLHGRLDCKGTVRLMLNKVMSPNFELQEQIQYGIILAAIRSCCK